MNAFQNLDLESKLSPGERFVFRLISNLLFLFIWFLLSYAFFHIFIPHWGDGKAVNIFVFVLMLPFALIAYWIVYVTIRKIALPNYVRRNY